MNILVEGISDSVTTNPISPVTGMLPYLLHVVFKGLRHGQFLLRVLPPPLLLSHELALSAVLTAPAPTAAPEEETRGRAEEARLDGGDDVLGQLVDVLGLHVVVGGVELQEGRGASGRHDSLLGEAAERGAAGGPGWLFNDVNITWQQFLSFNCLISVNMWQNVTKHTMYNLKYHIGAGTSMTSLQRPC